MYSITFTIGGQAFATHQINLTSTTCPLSGLDFIEGTYCKAIHYMDFDYGTKYGEKYQLESITIDDDSNMQYDQAKMKTVFEKLQKCKAEKTGSALLVGKKLTIQTGQYSYN